MRSEKVTELSVAQLFRQDQYSIPIYQRNYAWGEPEVVQLLQDIVDLALSKDSQRVDGYYLGSLIVYERPTQYETIDGQQRHTSLSIVLAVLKNEFQVNLPGINQLNISFDSRAKSARTLKQLFNGFVSEDLSIEPTMAQTYEVTHKFLRDHASNIESIADYLLNRVKLLRIVVPESTDLNNYFEVMNSRGEQLEKHEVLKARLIEGLADDERDVFSKVWDACSDMSRYVQLSISKEARYRLFGSELYWFGGGFVDLKEALKDQSDLTSEMTLSGLLENVGHYGGSDEGDSEHLNRFESIINFQNFLLHVLRVMTKKAVPLDDKGLLEIFSGYALDAKEFVVVLLKCRLLLDRYILKREYDVDWSLKQLRSYDGLRKPVTINYSNTFDDDDLKKHLVLIQSMFHVSFPAQARKHWLSGALLYLYNSVNPGSGEVEGEAYLHFLESMSDNFFFGRFRPGEPLDYRDLISSSCSVERNFDLSYLDHGTLIHNFIFNRLDYLLWKRLKRGHAFDDLNMNYIKSRVDRFSFTFRSSVEHYYPRNPIAGEKLIESEALPNGVDNFGNLCLISHSNNSRLSNYLPSGKKDHYEGSNAVESIKQVFMMSYPHWGPGHEDVIESHRQMMVEVLLNQTS